MKKSIALLTSVLAGTVAFGQSVAVNGTVTDQKGNPVPFAFVYSSNHPFATYADSTGMFSFKADPATPLVATANAFQKKITKIDNPSGMKIALTADASAGAKAISPDLQHIFNQEEGFIDMTEGSQYRKTQHQDNIHGSRFLFQDWVHGYIITPNDSIQQNNGYLFNYDKINGNLIFATGGSDMHLGVDNQIKQFVLFDGKAQSYTFEKVPAINAQTYMQVLAQGSKYKIYKDINAKFIKADFVNNGVTQHGNNFDEFKDDSVYYVVKLPGGQPQQLSPRKKAIKAMFAADADKVNKFMADNNGDIDDAYLKNLAELLNE
jgi:hypothetical protein